MESSVRMPTADLASALEVSDQRLVGDDDVDELDRLRAGRVAQLKQEQTWRHSGHGSLRELADEVEFLDVLQPRERGVVLISDGASDRCTQLLEVFEGLAQKHVETQFCHLELENAGLLAHAVDLDEGVPVVFVLKHGQVIKSLSPSQLFQLGAISSPKFRQHIGSLLRNLGAIGSDDALKVEGSDSESDGERGLH